MRFLLPLFLLLASLQTQALAQTVLLVHGYNSDAGSWRSSGISSILQRDGWIDAGILDMRPQGVFYYGIKPKETKRTYTANLPSEAPIELQATILSYYVRFLQKQHPEDKIYIIGHSAGGIAARYMMVRWPKLAIDSLVTIASPHLGSQTAKLGTIIGSSLLSFFAPFMGAGTINRSQRLYRQLSPENRGNLLGWLNRTPHPKARYISIIHSTSPNPAAGDSVVKGWRQDMNFVPALRGIAQSFVIPSDHALSARDGIALVQILRKLQQPNPSPSQARQ